MPSSWKFLASSAVMVAVECRPAREMSCKTKLARRISPAQCLAHPLCLPVFGQIPDEGLQRAFREALAHPIEGRAQVVDEFLAWIRPSYFSGEPGSVFDVRISRLQPQEIGIWREA